MYKHLQIIYILFLMAINYDNMDEHMKALNLGLDQDDQSGEHIDFLHNMLQPFIEELNLLAISIKKDHKLSTKEKNNISSLQTLITDYYKQEEIDMEYADLEEKMDDEENMEDDNNDSESIDDSDSEQLIEINNRKRNELEKLCSQPVDFSLRNWKICRN